MVDPFLDGDGRPLGWFWVLNEGYVINLAK